MLYRAICDSHHPLFFFQWRTTNLKVNLNMLFKRIKETEENGLIQNDKCITENKLDLLGDGQQQQTTPVSLC